MCRKQCVVAELVDLRGLAALAGLKYATVRTYRTRGVLPQADFVVGGSPAWRPSTVKRWVDKRNGVVKPARVYDPDAWLNY